MEMNSRQSWAIRCASGLDVRGLDISYDEARDILSALNHDEKMYNFQVQNLIARGAKGTPREYKPYVKGEKKGRKGKAPKRTVKNSREQEFQAIYDAAWEAGEAAAAKYTPTPMVVAEHVNPLDDSSPIKKVYAPVMGGVCGFASVEMPATSAFAKWLVQTGKARRQEYKGGIAISIWDYNQSYELKVAHAHAMADSLHNQGIKKVRVWDHID